MLLNADIRRNLHTEFLLFFTIVAVNMGRSEGKEKEPGWGAALTFGVHYGTQLWRRDAVKPMTMRVGVCVCGRGCELGRS